MNKGNIFDTQNSSSSDECWKLSKDLHNNQINNYHLYNNNFEKCQDPKVRMPDFYMDHINLRGRPGYGLSDSCLIDKYNNLVNNDELLTHDKCKIQIFERLFTSCPLLKGANVDYNKELNIKTGDMSNKYGCRKIIMEEQINKPIPMLDCIKKIQEPNNIVPIWVNGGEDTRSYINRFNFNNCKK